MNHTPETLAAIENLRAHALKYRQGAIPASERGDLELAGYLLAFAQAADHLAECLQASPQSPLVRLLALPFAVGQNVD